MTRHVVAIEGKQYADGRIILPGALRCEDEKIPVTLRFDFERSVGDATEMQRDEATGEISFEIDMIEDLSWLDLKHCDITIEAQPVRMEPRQNCPFCITEGRIRMVSVAPLPGFPKDAFPKEN